MCQTWIICEIGRIQIWDLFLALKFVSLSNLIPQSFSVPRLSFLRLSTSTRSIGFEIWTLPPFLPVSSMWSIASKPSMSLVTWAALIWKRPSEVTFCHSNTWGSSILLNNQSPYIVIWNNFVTTTYLVHQRPHFHLKMLLDHHGLEGIFKIQTFDWKLLLLILKVPAKRTPSIVKGNKSLSLVWSKWWSPE